MSSCIHMNFYPCLWPTCRAWHPALWNLTVIFTVEVPVAGAWAWQRWCWSMAVVRSGYSVWVLDRELVWNVWWKPLADTFWHHWEDRTIWINLAWSCVVDLQLFASVDPDIFRLLFACLRAAGIMKGFTSCSGILTEQLFKAPLTSVLLYPDRTSHALIHLSVLTISFHKYLNIFGFWLST